jgi:alkanesulfonate monooxygenase SsuD/methylene tetrahydromethanopterin reductase-like flavin-dependent oxidoreductase (luciferase family)
MKTPAKHCHCVAHDQPDRLHFSAGSTVNVPPQGQRRPRDLWAASQSVNKVHWQYATGDHWLCRSNTRQI